MASSVIKVNYGNYTQTGTLTPENGVSLNELLVKQVGKIVTVRGYAKLSSALSTTEQMKIATISGVALPYSIVRTLCGTGTQAYQAFNSGYLIIDSSGNIYCLTSTANQTHITFSFSYVV